MIKKTDFIFFRDCPWLIIGFTISLLAACIATPSPTFAPLTTTTIPILLTDTPTITSTPPPFPTVTRQPTDTPFPSATVTYTPVPTLIFAVIGDYGESGNRLSEVAGLIETWNVNFILTTGDNNYPSGSANTIDENIGQYFHQYISPYSGSFGLGAENNKFFPSLGNHDWIPLNAQPYLDYFTLPGNERYYDFTWGQAHFFALDSDSREPDGVGVSSDQARWLKASMEASTLHWKFVFFHHAPYSSSSNHGSTDWMQWPFHSWGATAVFAGHDHTYERLEVEGIPYFVVGLGGGGARYSFGEPLMESLFRYRDDSGALRVTIGGEWIVYEFITRNGEVIDTFRKTFQP